MAAGRPSMRGDQDQFWEAGGRYRPLVHPVVALFARQRVRYLQRVGALDGVGSLLDVGAGSGFSSSYYPPALRVVAADAALGMLAGNPVRERVLCAADRLPFAAGAFDAVTCWELLHHLADPTAAVREMLGVARRRVIVFDPNRINPGHLWLAWSRDNERGTLRFSPRATSAVSCAGPAGASSATSAAGSSSPTSRRFRWRGC